MKHFYQCTLICLSLLMAPLSIHAENVYISGSTTVQKYMKLASQAYQSQHPEHSFLVSGGGSTSGFGQFIDGRVDIGMMSRALTKKETLLLGKKQAIQVAFDAIVPIVSKEIYRDDHVTAIRMQALRDIYQGKISNWKDVGGSDKPILVVDKTTSHGTRHVFASHVFGSAAAPHLPSSIILEDNQDVFNLIVSSDQAIAYLSNAYKSPDLYALDLAMDGATVSATDVNVRSGKYPLSRPLFILVDEHPKASVQGFIDFLLSKEGQDLVREVGYTPIH